MADREKVMKGLECCKTENCSECPYEDTSAPVGKFGTDELVVCQPVLYADALSLLKAQEPVKPKFIDGKRNHFILCGNCNTDLIRGMKFCSYCGKAVKWND